MPWSYLSVLLNPVHTYTYTYMTALSTLEHSEQLLECYLINAHKVEVWPEICTCVLEDRRLLFTFTVKRCHYLNISQYFFTVARI